MSLILVPPLIKNSQHANMIGFSRRDRSLWKKCKTTSRKHLDFISFWVLPYKSRKSSFLFFLPSSSNTS